MELKGNKNLLNKRVLLIGRGHLGSFLRDLWDIPPELHWTGEMAGLDSTHLWRLRPSVVINTAGKTDLRWCEDNSLECFRCNVTAPLSIYRSIKNVFNDRVLYIHLSSGCIWDGPFNSDGGAFQPDDPPTPACFYSWTKACCDALLMAEATAPLLILRPRQVYSPVRSPRNTLMKLNGYQKLLDIPNSMTSANTIARTIETMIGKINDSTQARILNVYDLGFTSPYEVGVFLSQAGHRGMPERLDKTDLDSWHKPKRVDVVMKDEFFEEAVRPTSIRLELLRVIALFKP